MDKFAEKFSINFIGGVFGLTGYTFWAESYGFVFYFVIQIFVTMTENYFLFFAFLGALLLHVLNLFAVFIIVSLAYIVFMAWPEVTGAAFLAKITNEFGSVTAGSLLLSADAFRVYAMLVAVTFLDVLNIAHFRTKEGDS